MGGVQLNISFEPGAPRCCRCLRDGNEDGSSVTWRCVQCGGAVCRKCTLTDPSTLHREYYEETLCSQACKEARDKAIRDAQTVLEVMDS